MKIVQDIEEENSLTESDSEEENPDWNRFWSYNPSADESHQFGECMEDWHDYEWRKEQEEMDCRRENEIWERRITTIEDKIPKNTGL